MRKNILIFIMTITIFITITACNGKANLPNPAWSVESTQLQNEEITEETVASDPDVADEATQATEPTVESTTPTEIPATEAVTPPPALGVTASVETTGNTNFNQSEANPVATLPPVETTAPSVTEPTIPEETSPVETESKQPQPTVANATASDADEISRLVVQYINEYRASQGISAATWLPGLTEYAEYRSGQLVSNFAHDTLDERAAATALQYGKYVDPSVYGLSGNPYYTACAGEAIGMTGKVGTVDEVAKHIATMFFESTGHWSYVGSSEYVYIGVGITYAGCRWYCDIAMSKVNNG